jgi:hypothetical protein
MSRSRLRVLVRSCLLVAFCCGALTVVCGRIWVPVRDAAKVDAILSPDELRNSAFVDVVHRALAYKSLGETDAVYAVVGVVAACAAGVAWIAFERLCRLPDNRGP